MSIIHGKHLIIKKNGVLIAAQKSCDIDVRGEAIPVTSETNGDWQHHIAGKKSWTMTCNTLVTSLSDNVEMVGQTITASCGAGSDIISGSAIVTEWKLTGTIGNLAQAVASFLGSGPLLRVQVNPGT